MKNFILNTLDAVTYFAFVTAVVALLALSYFCGVFFTSHALRYRVRAESMARVLGTFCENKPEPFAFQFDSAVCRAFRKGQQAELDLQYMEQHHDYILQHAPDMILQALHDDTPVMLLNHKFHNRNSRLWIEGPSGNAWQFDELSSMDVSDFRYIILHLCQGNKLGFIAA